jgi:hypothetical protein
MLQQQAKADEATALEQRAQVDSASLMARYGARLTSAAAGGGGGAVAVGASPTLAMPSNLLSTILQNYSGGGLPSVAAQAGRVIGGGQA